MRKLSVWRIDKFAKTVGEAVLSATLSSFAVPLNSEVEDFIRKKALQATKLKSSISYLVIDEDLADVVGYFTLLVKPFTIQAASLSSKNRRLIARFAEENTEAGDYTASVYLIAQIGKNYAIEEPLQISGGDLLNMAMNSASRFASALVMSAVSTNLRDSLMKSVYFVLSASSAATCSPTGTFAGSRPCKAPAIAFE